MFRRGQHFAMGSVSPISTVLNLKLTSVCNMSLYFSKILELTVCRIINMNKQVYMSVKNMPNKTAFD